MFIYWSNSCIYDIYDIYNDIINTSIYFSYVLELYAYHVYHHSL